MNKYIFLIYMLIILLILYINNCSRYNFLTEDEWNDLYNDKKDNNTSISFSSGSIISTSSSSSSSSSISSLYSRVFGTVDVDEGMAVAADTAGNIYIAGNTYGNYASSSAGNADIIITQIRTDGTEGWKKQYGSTQDDIVNDIKYQSGLLYIVGVTHGAFFTSNSDTTSELFIITVNTSNGFIEDSFQFDMAGTNITGSAIEVDPTGVYITGYTNGGFYGETVTGAGTSDIIIAKYSLNLSTRVWSDLLGSTGTDRGKDLVLDTANNFIYLTGSTTDTLFAGADAINGDTDIILAQYNKNGSGNINPNPGFTRQYCGSNEDYPTGITIDNAGNIYITGNSNSMDFISTGFGNHDVFLIKIASTDLSILTDYHKFETISEDSSTRIKFRNEAGTDYLYIASILSSGSTSDFVRLLKIRADALSNIIWERITYSSGNDIVSGLCLDNFWNVYLTGIVDTDGNYDFIDNNSGKIINGYAGDDDVFILKYDAAGNLK